jgi:hypothetical protein
MGIPDRRPVRFQVGVFSRYEIAALAGFGLLHCQKG